MSDTSNERSFQTGHQIGLYRKGPASEPGAIPLSVEALEAKAKARLSEVDYDWVAGMAGGGGTGRANRSAFDRWRIVPRMLTGIEERDFSVELFGERWPFPVALAPIGVQTGCDPDGEKASARGAAALGITHILSTVSSFSMEEDVDAAAELYLQVFSDLSRTWKSLRFLRENTELPLLVKGIQHPDDARRALDEGMDGVVVSNHGGRQTDGSVGTLEVLPGVAEAVGDAAPVLFDRQWDPAGMRRVQSAGAGGEGRVFRAAFTCGRWQWAEKRG